MYNIKKHINMHITKSITAWCSAEEKERTYNIVTAHQLRRQTLATYKILLSLVGFPGDTIMTTCTLLDMRMCTYI